MKLYIAGPMTGITQFNFPAFSVAKSLLSFYHPGFEFVSPAELDSEESREAARLNATGDPELYRDMTGETWGDLLSRDVKVVADEADGVVLLRDWEGSKGARLEAFVACCAGKPVYDYAEWVGEDGTKITDHPVDRWELVDAFAEIGRLYFEEDKGSRKIDAVVEKTLRFGERYGFTSSMASLMASLARKEAADDVELSSGEVRVTSATGGQKGQKPQRTDLLPPEFLLSLSEVYGFGAEKYDDHNYLKGYDWSLSFAAALRHLMAAMDDEWLDPESGLPHVSHVAWHMAALFMFERHGLGTDDRIKSVVEGVN